MFSFPLIISLSSPSSRFLTAVAWPPFRESQSGFANWPQRQSGAERQSRTWRSAPPAHRGQRRFATDLLFRHGGRSHSQDWGRWDTFILAGTVVLFGQLVPRASCTARAVYHCSNRFCRVAVSRNSGRVQSRVGPRPLPHLGHRAASRAFPTPTRPIQDLRVR